MYKKKQNFTLNPNPKFLFHFFLVTKSKRDVKWGRELILNITLNHQEGE